MIANITKEQIKEMIEEVPVLTLSLYHIEKFKDKNPKKELESKGITFSLCVAQSIADCWDFWGVKNLPCPLPDYYKVSNRNPIKSIGYGLSKEDAELIISEHGKKQPVPRSFEGYLPKNHPYFSKPDLKEQIQVKHYDSTENYNRTKELDVGKPTPDPSDSLEDVE